MRFEWDDRKAASNLKKRGKYAARMAEGSNIVRLDPDLARAFPDSPSVNEALRLLLRIAERASAQTNKEWFNNNLNISHPTFSPSLNDLQS